MDFDLTIGITSYNRVNELMRCLNSIDIKHFKTEVLISEDKSPKREEIRKRVEEFAKESNYTVVFHSNQENLGYDRNLGNIIKMARGKYILFMSDDDCFNEGTLDNFVLQVMQDDANLGYAAFEVGKNRELRRKYSNTFRIHCGLNSVNMYYLDAILFSGLMFKKTAIAGYSAERFLNHYYFQVYIFMKVLEKFGAIYVSSNVVWSVGDGENAYGKSESSIKNNDLSDRKSIYSNIEFNKGLIKVIKIFDKEENGNVLEQYEKDYSLRSYMGLSQAKKAGNAFYDEYWKRLNSLDVRLRYPVYIYKFMLDTMGYRISDKIMFFIREKVMERIRNRHI